MKRSSFSWSQGKRRHEEEMEMLPFLLVSQENQFRNIPVVKQKNSIN